MPLDNHTITVFQTTLLAWFHRHGRRLPWRENPTPYHVLVSEFMLQQTQVERVIPYYHRFLSHFPDLSTLALAPLGSILRLWSGLGYNQRAVRLQAVAQHVITSFHGNLPRDIPTLRTLPGIGPYTARAIACFAFGLPVPAIDTNIRRVITRLITPAPKNASPRHIEAYALALLSFTQPAAWNQALMDLGATICLARTPRCSSCPVLTLCQTGQHSIHTGSAPQPITKPRPTERFTGSRRFLRGHILRTLVQEPATSAWPLSQLAQHIAEHTTLYDTATVIATVKTLAQEGLLTLHEPTVDPLVTLPDAHSVGNPSSQSESPTFSSSPTASPLPSSPNREELP